MTTTIESARAALTNTLENLRAAKAEIDAKLAAPALDGTPFLIRKTVVGLKNADGTFPQEKWIYGIWNETRGWANEVAVPWHACGALQMSAYDANCFVNRLRAAGFDADNIHIRDWYKAKREEIKEAIAYVSSLLA